jgi:DNA repair photolyase
VIYCSPLTDPWQPAEETQRIMPAILAAAIAAPPRVFVIQTRGPMILRDLDLLLAMGDRLRVSFSVTTDRDDVRRIFEPHCASVEERWRTVEALRNAGIAVSVAMAPILPCDPEALVERAAAVSNGPLIADPFHIRAVKRSGATTREAAARICERHGWSEWLDPAFQREVLARMERRARGLGREFGYGTAGFGMLVRKPAC